MTYESVWFQIQCNLHDSENKEFSLNVTYTQEWYACGPTFTLRTSGCTTVNDIHFLCLMCHTYKRTRRNPTRVITNRIARTPTAAIQPVKAVWTSDDNMQVLRYHTSLTISFRCTSTHTLTRWAQRFGTDSNCRGRLTHSTTVIQDSDTDIMRSTTT